MTRRRSPLQWGAHDRLRTVAGSAAELQLASSGRRRRRSRLEVKLDRKVGYELDGGDREKVKKFTVEVDPGAVSVCVPDAFGLEFGMRERLVG